MADDKILEERLKAELDAMRKSYETHYHSTAGYYVAACHYGESEKYWQYIRLIQDKDKKEK